jgi:Dimerisation domain
MSSGNDVRSAGAARESGSAEPTVEQRAAAAAVLRMISGIPVSRAIYAAAELGIADHLAGGPMTAGQLARATQAHEPSLYRVLRLLASLGVLAEQDGRSFGLTVPHYARAGDEAYAPIREALTVSGDIRPADGEPLIRLDRSPRPGAPRP